MSVKPPDHQPLKIGQGSEWRKENGRQEERVKL